MTGASRLFVFDNPIVGGRLRCRFRGKAIAVIVAIHVALLLATLILVNQLYAWRVARDLRNTLPFSNALLLSFYFVESLALVFLAPIGGGAVLAEEKRAKCFDQLAMSGVSPWRVFSGNLCVATAFILLLLVSGLPFFTLCWVFGGVSASGLAMTYILFFAYGFCLITLPMALEVSLGDPGGAVVITAFASVFVNLATATMMMPPLAAALTPLTHGMATAFGHAARYPFRYLPTFAFSAGLNVPYWFLSLICFSLISALSLLHVAIGPDLYLSPGIDNFDAVVPVAGGKEKRKRGSSASSYLGKVQFAFLYENRSDFLKRYDAIARGLLKLLMAAALFFALARAFTGSLLRIRDAAGDGLGDETVILFTLCTFVWPCLIALRMGTTKFEIARRNKSFPKRPFNVDIVFFMIRLLVPIAVFVFWLYVTGNEASEIHRGGFVILYVCGATYALVLFNALTLVSSRMTYPPSAYAWGCVLVLLMNVLPFVWYPFFALRLLPGKTAYLSQLSPILAIHSIAYPHSNVHFWPLFGRRFDFIPDWHVFFYCNIALLLVLIPLSARAVRRLQNDD